MRGDLEREGQVLALLRGHVQGVLQRELGLLRRGRRRRRPQPPADLRVSQLGSLSLSAEVESGIEKRNRILPDSKGEVLSPLRSPVK